MEVGERSNDRTESYFIKMPDDIIAVTHAGQLSSGFMKPKGIEKFSEPINEGSVAFILKLRDENRKVIGYSAQLEVMAMVGDGGSPVMDTEWILVVPGRGTLFLHEVEKPTEIFETFQPYIDSGDAWKGNIEVLTTAGPNEDGTGKVVGGTGEFSGADGYFLEINRFTEYDPSSENGLIGELEIRVTYRN